MTRALLVCHGVFAIGGSWWFRGVLGACFVPFERSMKLRETAIEQESLQLFKIITFVSHFWHGHPPFIREVVV